MRSTLPPMTLAELRELPLTVPVYPTVARALGLGRTAVYRMARNGTLPVPVTRNGNRYQVRLADLVRAVGVDLSEAA